MDDDEDDDSLDGHVEALNDAADAMHAARDVDETLRAIVTQARLTLPGIDHVGITVVRRDGSLETVARTDDLVERFDDLQYRVGEGPCLTALEADETVVVEEARHEQRWPLFIREAVPLGLKAQLGIRLFRDRQGIAALNMYSVEREHLDPHLPHLAELFARHAAHAFGHARHTEQLETALATRSLIGQALGIVMERFGIDETRAFDYLTRTSTAQNLKLRDVARRLVDEVNLQAPSAPV